MLLNVLCVMLGQGLCSRVAFLFNELGVARRLLKPNHDVVAVCCDGQDSHSYGRLWDRLGERVSGRNIKESPQRVFALRVTVIVL